MDDLNSEKLRAGTLKGLISRGEYLRAFDLGDRYISTNDEIQRDILKLHTLCMSKLGMTDRAISLLESSIENEDTIDPESRALLGSFYKRRWLASNTDSRSDLESAFANYMECRSMGGGYWCTINAAALALYLDKKDLSEELADEVISECWEEYNKHGTNSEYWIPASMGEAYLIKGEYGSAARWYKSSRSHLGRNIGQIRTTRLNSEMIMAILDPPAKETERIRSSIKKPRIAIFAGHRIDDRERSQPRFPDHISGKVKKRLKKELIRMKLDIGIASAADGSDIIFHECLQETGKITHIILPAPVDHFRKNLLELRGRRWAERFDRAVRGSARIETTSNARFSRHNPALYKLASDYMLEYAMDLCKAFDADPLPIVVWDRNPSSHPGGTGYMVNRFRSIGITPKRIPIDDLVDRKGETISKRVKKDVFPYKEKGIFEPDLKPLIAISILNDSMTEEDIASALSRLAQTVSGIIDEMSIRMVTAGTAARGLFLLMDNAESTLDFCRELQERSQDLPAFTTVLHCGIATMLETSITGRRDYYCREVKEALETVCSLKESFVISTMQFRSACAFDLDADTTFHYFGRFRTEEGNLLKLFKLEIGKNGYM